MLCAQNVYSTLNTATPGLGAEDDAIALRRVLSARGAQRAFGGYAAAIAAVAAVVARHRTSFALERACASAPQALRKAGAHIQHVASNTQRAKRARACEC